MDFDFSKFDSTFPIFSRDTIVGEKMEQLISSNFGIAVPRFLLEFWNAHGGGYFGERELFFFSFDTRKRDSLIEWNSKDYWNDILPKWSRCRPLFFAETLFGEQIGFRRLDGHLQIVLYIVDSNELFILAHSFEELFSKVLVTKDAIWDPKILIDIRKRLGELPDGMHYAPILSPFLGGDNEASNFSIQSPDVHFISAIAVFKAVRQLPPGSRIDGIDVEFE